MAVHTVEVRHPGNLDRPDAGGLRLVAVRADGRGRLQPVHGRAVAGHAFDLFRPGMHVVPGGRRHLAPLRVAADVAGLTPLGGDLRVLAHALRAADGEGYDLPGGFRDALLVAGVAIYLLMLAAGPAGPGDLHGVAG